MKLVIGKAKTSYSKLATLLTETEKSKTTHLHLDNHNDLQQPLTQAHFLGNCRILGRGNFNPHASSVNNM